MGFNPRGPEAFGRWGVVNIDDGLGVAQEPVAGMVRRAGIKQCFGGVVKGSKHWGFRCRKRKIVLGP